jgi:hypothetical protein
MSEFSASKQYYAEFEFDRRGMTVRVKDAGTGRNAAVLAPRDYVPTEYDVPVTAWSHESETLAVATLKHLWVWRPELRFFDQVVPWHWTGKEVPLHMIKWSKDDNWILRRFCHGQLNGERVWRFECVELSARRVIPAQVSYPAITIAEWMDDEPTFAINVIVDVARHEYRSVHVDARTGELLREYE